MAIREAIASDLPQIMRLLHLKAEFDGCPQSVRATLPKLKDTLFTQTPMAYVLLAETTDSPNPIGFASYHFTYSTFLAQPSIWLDDLFIESAHRNQSIGTQLIQTLCKIARARSCGRVDWTVDVENQAGIRFYQRIGAQLQTQVHLCRLDQTAIEQATLTVARPQSNIQNDM